MRRELSIPHRSRVVIGASASVFATVWSLVALGTTASSLDTDPFADRLALGIMGFAFLAIGLLAYRRNRSLAVYLFWLYCAFSCLHWGGVIGGGESHTEIVLLALYVLLGSALPQSVFLHLATAYPARPTVKRWHLALLYAPVALGVLLLGLAVANAVSLALVLSLVGVAVAYSVLGGIVWLYKLATRGTLRPAVRAALLGAFAFGWLPHIGANAGLYELGDYAVLALLPLVAIPLALGWLYCQAVATRKVD